METRVAGILKWPPELRLSVLQGLHRGIEKLLGTAGFRFEERRNGESVVGLWRLSLGRSPARGRRRPRRVVFVPGFGDTPLSWMITLNALRPVLAKKFDELVCVDFPGFAGFLRHRTAIESFDAMAERVEDILDSLSPGVVLGHSLGGWLAADYAIRRAERGLAPLESLILVAPSGVFGDEAERARWASVFSRSMKEGFRAIRPLMFEKEPPGFGLLAREIEAFTRREDIRLFMSSIAEKHRLEARLPKLEGRAWILWGERDRLVPAGWLPHWHRALEGAPATVRSVSLKGVGHSPQLEAPLVTAAVIGQILSGRSPHWAGSRLWKVHSG